jgi:hypothetical protein
MANLYELNEAIAKFEFEIDEETGEILNVEALEGIELERKEKIENIALWIKNLKSDAEAYKREKDSFAKKQKVAENKMESLKEYLSGALRGEKFRTDRVQISYRPSQRVEIMDEGKIPEAYLIAQPPKVDKQSIKEALKNGEVVDGATLVDSENIQVR